MKPRKQTHAQISAKGGKAGTGKTKARSSEQARAAANARWTKAKSDKFRLAIAIACGHVKGTK